MLKNSGIIDGQYGMFRFNLNYPVIPNLIIQLSLYSENVFFTAKLRISLFLHNTILTQLEKTAMKCRIKRLNFQSALY